MNDYYSKYIMGEDEEKGAGFVTTYGVRDGQLLVSTPETKSSEPHQWGATYERIKHIDDRQKTQYQLLIENHEQVIKDKNAKARKIIYTIVAILAGTSVATGFGTNGISSAETLELAKLLSQLAGTLGISVAAAGEAIIAVCKENFKSKINMFDMYIKKAESISKLAKKDKNITRHLSRDAQELIRANKDLAAQGLIDEVFNVGLMDKMNPKDLKELLTRYQVSVKLYQTQVFRTPNETKKRTRTPKTK